MLNILRFLFFISTFFNFYLLSSTENTQLQCKDEKNRPVDWFFIYKLPKIPNNNNPWISKGRAYAYITSDGVNDGWKLSETSIGSETSIPGYTLAPLYKKNDSIIWTLYNDHAPKKNATAKHGHTKGVVMADAQQGFWLVHSVPQYPPAPENHMKTPASSYSERSKKTREGERTSEEGYSYPSTGERYGQSFLCISVNKYQFDIIGMQLIYNQILPYMNNLPERIAVLYPILTKAANKIRQNNPPYNLKASITSLNGAVFWSFAKSDKWGKDLYDEFVAPQLGSDLLVETWRRGSERLPSHCSGIKVMNVEFIEFTKAGVVFPTTVDHSKWAVSNVISENDNWVCVGDINRIKTQLGRGGGTVCLNSKPIMTNYREIVNKVESCPTIKMEF